MVLDGGGDDKDDGWRVRVLVVILVLRVNPESSQGHPESSQGHPESSQGHPESSHSQL